MKRVFTFGFLEIKKQILKTTYWISNRNLELASINEISFQMDLNTFKSHYTIFYRI